MCCRPPQVRKLTGKYDGACVMYEVRRVRACDGFHGLARETRVTGDGVTGDADAVFDICLLTSAPRASPRR